ncbi:hypothetical protein Tco_0645282, partial [Tanacetum coccineum]
IWDVVDLVLYCQDSNDAQDNTNRYSEPMIWIGIYIAIASLVCILAMAADLLHGLQNKKFWFPCKYFTLNAASITVIIVAMKLPVDLSSEMPSYMDQATKLGSLAFMCMMMANLMPSLASMDNKTLLANVIGLSILVITMIANIIIDLNTGVINHVRFNFLGSYGHSFDCVTVAYIYMAMILLLLIIMISSSLTISALKEILEIKYQATNKASLTDQSLQQTHMCLIEKLRQHVKRYWVMAETGSPQFVMASNPLSTTTGVICVIVLIMNILVVLEIRLGYHGEAKVYRSAYKWSMLFIIITQSIGVVVGTIAPIFRCFSVLSFNLVTQWDRNHLMVFKVENYWTQQLHDWKQSYILFLTSSRRSRTLLYNFKNIILSVCITSQKAIVVSCKIIWLIPLAVLRLVCCWNSLMAKLFTPPIFSNTDVIDTDLSMRVLQIHEEMELAEKTLTGITNSMNSFILKAEKKQNNDLLRLLEKSTGFKGGENFDTDRVQPLLSVELVNSWSLPIVTLTCIAVALPHIPKDRVESLVKSVGEGLSYTHLVEESLNISSEYSKGQYDRKTAIEILKWFADKAEEIVKEISKSSNGIMVENNISKDLIASNSMYRIAQTILLREHGDAEPLSKKQLFALLNGMIADIFSACFTNIPQVIEMRSHETVIEKREACVRVAAKLLGKTTKIIEWLETVELPSMDDDKMAYIDE